MKKILFLALMLISLSGIGQTYGPDGKFGTIHNRSITYFDLGIPRDTFAVPVEFKKWPHIAAKGAIMYLWDTLALKWGPYAPGTDALTGLGDSPYGLIKVNDSTYKVDTFYITTRLRLYKVVDSLMNFVNQRVKYTDTALMLLPYHYYVFNSTTNGLVPFPGTPVGKFLKDNATWAYPVDSSALQYISKLNDSTILFHRYRGDPDTMQLNLQQVIVSGGGGAWGTITGTLADQTDLQTALNAKQPLDADLTTIAGLTATTDNFMQSKAGAWASRTIAQVKTDLGLSGTNTGDQTSIVGITGTTAQFNTALTDNDFATLAGTETLTNKTLTSPFINTPTGIVKGDVGLGNVDNTSDATKNAATVTLTNKTINLTSNTLSGTTAQFNTALSDNDFTTLAGTETLTNKTLTSPQINTPKLNTSSTTGYVWTASSTDGSGGWAAAAGGGANTALSNLASVSINTALIPQVGIDLGAVATPFRNIFFYGQGTFGSHSYKFDGTPTANRVITFPDASITVARIDAAQTFTGVQTFGSTIVGSINGNAATATALQTARSIYGNNFDGTTALSQIIASTYGGTGNGFSKFSGATTSEKTYTLPDASTTILTTNYTGALGTGILKNTTTTGALSIAVAADFPTLNQSTTGSAAILTTSRSIYGNNFNGSADLSQVIASTYGGTGNGFTKFTGPTTTEKTFTLPNASATILTDNAVVTSQQGGTGVNNGGRTITIGTNSGTFAFGAASKTLTINNSLGLTGTDGTTMTFPSTSATVARTDAAQTFTGTQTFSSNPKLNTTSTVGYVWTASGTDGSGGWAAASGGGGVSEPVDYTLKAYAALGSAIVAQSVGVDISDINPNGTMPTLSDGYPELIPVWIPSAQTITGVKWFQEVQGNFTADNYNGLALYTYSGGTLTKVAQTTDDANCWRNSTETWQSKAFATPYSASAGLHYVVLYYNSSSQTTAPKIGGKVVNAAVQAVMTADFANSAKLYAYYYGGGASVLSTISMGGSTAAEGYPRIYVGLY